MGFFSPHKRHANKFNYIPRYYDPAKEEREMRRAELRGERIRPSELFELLDENCEEFNAILDLNYGDKLTGEVAERFFFDSVKTLKLQMIDEAIAECNALYMKETDLEKRKEISKTLQALVAQKKELKRKK